MKKKIILIASLLTLGFVSIPALAVPTIQFVNTSGGWSYDPISHTFSFNQDISINKVLGSTTDSLVNKGYVYVPDLIVSGGFGGPYTLTPSGPIEIKDVHNNTLLSGTLGEGTLIPIYTTGAAYAEIKTDITNMAITNSIGSAVLDTIAISHGMDFSINLTSNIDFVNMIDVGISDGDGLSGGMTITTPAPGAILLGSIGICLVGWLRRHGTL